MIVQSWYRSYNRISLLYRCRNMNILSCKLSRHQCQKRAIPPYHYVTCSNQGPIFRNHHTKKKSWWWLYMTSRPETNVNPKIYSNKVNNSVLLYCVKLLKNCSNIGHNIEHHTEKFDRNPTIISEATKAEMSIWVQNHNR